MTGEAEINADVVRLSEYLARVRSTPLPDDAREKTAQHALDTLAAAVSGSQLPPGAAGAAYVHGRAGEVADATVVGTHLRAAADWAAMANGMAAHADETDDSHEGSWSHPGCAVVPAALAMAERNDRNIGELLRSVAAGYDVGARVMFALGRDHISWWERGPKPAMRSMWSTHAYVGLFGATGAAAALSDLDARGIRYALSYGVQQASGCTTYIRDVNHIEKAYVFGGMPARNGVGCALMVGAGFDGLEDPFDGSPGFLKAFSPAPQPAELSDQLGERFEVGLTNIKKFAVGSPAQAPVQALLNLTESRPIPVDDVEEIVVRLPADYANVVDRREMPDVNVQYLVAVSLLEGGLSFVAAHDHERFALPQVRRVMDRISLVADPDLETSRQAIVELTLVGAETRRDHVKVVRGTVGDPMSTAEVVAKATDLMEPVLGVQSTEDVVAMIMSGDEATGVRDLAAKLARPSR